MKKLDSFRLYATITLFLLGNTLVDTIVLSGKKGFLLSIMLAAAMAVVLFTFFVLPFLKYPYLTFENCIRLKAGKTIEKAALILVSLLAFFSAASVYFEFLRFFSTVALDATPDIISSALVSFFVILTALTGIKAVSGAAAYVFILIAAFSCFMFAEGMGAVSADIFVNTFSENAETVLRSAFWLCFRYLGDILLCVMFVGRETDGKKLYKTSLFSVLTWFVITALFAIFPVAVFGDGTKIFKYPVFQALSTFDNFPFMPKCGFGFVALFFLAVIVKLTVTADVFCRAATLQCGNDKKRRPLFIIGAFLLITAFSHAALTTQIGIGEKLAETSAASGAIIFLFVIPIWLLRYKKRR